MTPPRSQRGVCLCVTSIWWISYVARITKGLLFFPGMSYLRCVCICLRHNLLCIHIRQCMQTYILKDFIHVYIHDIYIDEPVARGCCWWRGLRRWCAQAPQSRLSILKNHDVQKTGSTQSLHPESLLTSWAHSGARRWAAAAAVGGPCWAARMLRRIKHSTLNPMLLNQEKKKLLLLYESKVYLGVFSGTHLELW